MKKIILAFCVFSLICSCSSDSGDKKAATPSQTTTTANPLSGLWKLSNISGGVAGVNQNFGATDYTLNFDTVSRSVNIVKNVTNPYLTLATGVYSYSLETVSGQNFIIINGTDRKRIALATNLLLDDNVLDDGLFFKYVR